MLWKRIDWEVWENAFKDPKEEAHRQSLGDQKGSVIEESSQKDLLRVGLRKPEISKQLLKVNQKTGSRGQKQSYLEFQLLLRSIWSCRDRSRSRTNREIKTLPSELIFLLIIRSKQYLQVHFNCRRLLPSNTRSDESSREVYDDRISDQVRSEPPWTKDMREGSLSASYLEGKCPLCMSFSRLDHGPQSE